MRPLTTLQKSQDCFQISTHVSFISKMLVAHDFSKISPELEMQDLRVSFELRFYIVGGPEARNHRPNAGIHRQILNCFNLGFPLVQHPLCFHESTYILLRHIPCLKPGSALRNYALNVWRAVYLICSLLLHHQHN